MDIEADFKNVTKDHKMTIVKNDGVHRHLRFKSDKTNVGWFDIITWPGCLCIHGDYGSYVFTRLNDMFEFFRSDGKGRDINPSYWAEKVVAEDRNGGILEFSKEKFKTAVKEEFDAIIEYREFSAGLKDKIWAEIESDILSRSDDYSDGRKMFESLHHFVFAWSSAGLTQAERDELKRSFRFEDFDHQCQEYTLRYIWNLHAIVWAIKKFDEPLDIVSIA